MVADHLRRFPPVGVDTHALGAILNSVEAPWGARIERQIREVWEGKAVEHQKSALLVEKVRELGLQPYQAPQPLPPIDEDQVMLICWMAVT